MTSNVRRAGFAAVMLLACAAASAAAGDGRIPFPKPGSHDPRWIEFHGKAVLANGGSAARPGEECTTCHERNDCIACHAMRLPRDHTNFWRTRGHGLQASANRERCRTCHQQDYCIRCHSETAPRSHTAGWRARHCGWCHYGSGYGPADNCSVCHKRALHLSAPHPVNPGVNCRQCHK